MDLVHIRTDTSPGPWGHYQVLFCLSSSTCSPSHPWAQEPPFSPHGRQQSLPNWGVILQSSLWPCRSKAPWVFSAHNSSRGWTLRSPPPFSPFWGPWLASYSGPSFAVPEVINDPVAGTWCCPPYGSAPLGEGTACDMVTLCSCPSETSCPLLHSYTGILWAKLGVV